MGLYTQPNESDYFIIISVFLLLVKIIISLLATISPLF